MAATLEIARRSDSKRLRTYDAEVRIEEPDAYLVPPFVIEGLEKASKQRLVALLPSLQKTRNVVDRVHEVGDAIGLSGRESVDVTAVRDHSCMDRRQRQDLEACGEERFRSEHIRPRSSAPR